MDKNSQDKVIKAGFTIIRKDDYPQNKDKSQQSGVGLAHFGKIRYKSSKR